MVMIEREAENAQATNHVQKKMEDLSIKAQVKVEEPKPVLVKE